MRGAWFWLVLCAPLGCATTPPTKPPRAITASPHAPAPAGAPATVNVASAALQKTFTGQAQPSLVVKNALPVAQHVFIDWVELAVLAPAASQTFELPAGTHTVTCADSADPDDHPAAVTETFTTGYAYAYQLHPGG